MLSDPGNPQKYEPYFWGGYYDEEQMWMVEGDLGEEFMIQSLALELRIISDV